MITTTTIIFFQNGQIIKQLDDCKVCEDGRIMELTAKGFVYLVSKNACKKEGIDPLYAMFNESKETVYHRLNVTLEGVTPKGSGMDLTEGKSLTVPHLKEVKAAYDAWQNDIDRYYDEQEKNYESESCTWAKPVDPNLKQKYLDLKAKYPVAAEFLKYQRLERSTSWQDNTYKARAAKKAMAILAETPNSRGIEQARQTFERITSDRMNLLKKID